MPTLVRSYGTTTTGASNSSITISSVDTSGGDCLILTEQDGYSDGNPSTPDLGLAEGSPCIDAGYATAGVSYNGAAPDIGYLESDY